MEHLIRRVNYNLIFVQKTREIKSVILDILDYVDVVVYIFDYSIYSQSFHK